MEIEQSAVVLDLVVTDGLPDKQLVFNNKTFVLTATWHEDGKMFAHYTTANPKARDIDDEKEDVDLLAVSVAQAARIADVTEQSVRDVLRDDERRKATFPSAFRWGTMQRGGWRMLRSEVEAWEPKRVNWDDGE